MFKKTLEYNTSKEYLLGIIQNTLENYVLATTTTTITTTKYGYTYNKFTALLNKLLK